VKNGTVKPKNINVATTLFLENSENFTEFKSKYLMYSKIGGYYDYLTMDPLLHWECIKTRFGDAIEINSLYGWFRDNHQKITGSIQLAISPLVPNTEVVALEIENTYGNATTAAGNEVIDPFIGGAFTHDNAYYWWQKVCTMFEKCSMYNTRALFNQILNLKCNSDTDINIFITNFRSIWTKLNQILSKSKVSTGNVLPDDLYVILMEQCCSKHYQHIGTILEQTGTLTPLNFEQQLRLLYNQKNPEGVRLVNDVNGGNSGSSGTRAEKAHAVMDTPSRGGSNGKQRWKHRKKYNTNSGNHANDGSNNGKGSVRKNSDGNYEFNFIDHSNTIDETSQEPTSDAETDLAIGIEGYDDSDSDYSDSEISQYDYTTTNNGGTGTGTAFNADESYHHMWTLKLDSGATRHIISNPNLFISSTKPGFSFTVKGLMGTRGTVTAIGTIRLTHNIIIHNVWYVKNAGVNLISLGRLLDDGAGINIDIKGAELLDGPKGKRIAYFNKVDTLFTLLHHKAPEKQRGYAPKRDLEVKPLVPKVKQTKAPLKRIPKKKGVNGGNTGSSNTTNNNGVSGKFNTANTKEVSASTKARETLLAARKNNGGSAAIVESSDSEGYFAGGGDIVDPCMQLHTNLGHVTVTKEVAAAAGVPYTTDITVNDCDTCLLTKSTRKKTGAGKYDKPSKPFERVSMDLIGPVSNSVNGELKRLPSKGGNIYVLVIIDEYTKYVWLRLLKNKSDTAGHIINYINMIKTQYNVTIKTIHTDGGTEFRNHQLENYYNSNGIISTYTTAGSPFHNGSVERFNRTLKTTVTAMLHGSGASVELWGEAVIYTQYIRNRTPLKALQYKTPYEMLNGKSGSTNKIHTFGSDAIVNTTATINSGKFQVPAVRGIYVGVSEQQNAIRVLTPNGKITVSRDVKVLDNRFEHIALLNASANDADEALRIIFDDPDGGQEVEVVEQDTTDTNNNGVTPLEPLQNSDVADQYEPSLPPIVEDDELESKYDSITSKSSTNTTTTGNNITSLDTGGSTTTRTGRTVKPVTRYGSINVDDLDPLSRRQLKREIGGAYAHYVSDNDSIEIITDNDSVVYSTVSSGNSNVSDVNIVDPISYKAAISSTNANQWQQAMDAEIEALTQQQVLIPVTPPQNTKLLKTRWVYKTKLDEHNRVAKYKARLVVKGYNQEAGIDFFETFAPVSKGKTLKVLLSLAAQYKLHIKQLDFKNAFLNAILPEDIYISVPEGYTTNDGTTVKAFKLNKSLYGLKQAPFLWYSTIHALLTKLGYTNTVSDMCTYVKHVPNSTIPIIISLYVDDMITLVPPALESIWNADKAKISSTYEIVDLGDAKWILKMLITRDPTTGTITLSQQAYVDMIVAKYYSGSVDAATTTNPGMVSYDLTEPDTITKYGATPLTADERIQYMSIVGALGYLSNTTRIDIAYAVNMLQRNTSNPTTVHMKCAINVIKYLKGTANYGLVFKNSGTTSPFQITGYSDADYGGDKSTRKSTSGSVIMLNGNIVAWSSKKQPTVALSTMESEYVALVNAATDMLWIKSWLLEVIPQAVIPPMQLWCDNQSTVHILGKDNHHATTKHMDIKLHFIRDHINGGTISVKWISTVDQVADLLTKTLGGNRFQTLVSKLITTVNK
jgi:hypothetical protein